MSRRTVASLLAAALLGVLFVVAVTIPVPYITMSPGPTVDVLAETKGEEIVQVDGHDRYETEGRLELTTIKLTGPDQEVKVGEALRAWFDRSRAVYPREVFYAPDESEQDVETQSEVQMVSSQDTAVAVALTELGFELDKVTEVLAVTPGSPAEDKLEKRDHVVAVNGTEIRDAADVAEIVQATPAGEAATFVVRRKGEEQTVRVVPEPSEDDADVPRVGVVVGPSYDFPFDVTVNIDERIGGPSAGLIFSLAVYDTLTPGALTGGAAIAGTGTIAEDGSVGPIGGIQQKILAAADSGAELFLVPPDNCDAAAAVAGDVEEMRLVKAPTMHSAVESIEQYVDDPDAELPACG
ncbi:MAG TPA: PDZ domain-containing protein [Nocardioidaceae bacterium]